MITTTTPPFAAFLLCNSSTGFHLFVTFFLVRDSSFHIQAEEVLLVEIAF